MTSFVKHRYLNLLKTGLRPSDVPSVFALLRKAQTQQQQTRQKASDHKNINRKSWATKETGNEGKGGDYTDHSGGDVGGNETLRGGSSSDGGSSCWDPSICDRLGLSHNTGLGPSGAAAVSRELLLPHDPSSSSSSSREISVSNGDMDDKGTGNDLNGHTILPAAPPSTTTTTPGSHLRDLFFSDCAIGPAGACALALALPACPLLEKLGLNYNGTMHLYLKRRRFSFRYIYLFF